MKKIVNSKSIHKNDIQLKVSSAKKKLNSMCIRENSTLFEVYWKWICVIDSELKLNSGNYSLFYVDSVKIGNLDWICEKR